MREKARERVSGGGGEQGMGSGDGMSEEEDMFVVKVGWIRKGGRRSRVEVKGGVVDGGGKREVDITTCPNRLGVGQCTLFFFSNFPERCWAGDMLEFFLNMEGSKR